MFKIDIKCSKVIHDITVYYYWTNICYALGLNNGSWYWKYVNFLNIIMNRIRKLTIDTVNYKERFLRDERHIVSFRYYTVPFKHRLLWKVSRITEM